MDLSLYYVILGYYICNARVEGRCFYYFAMKIVPCRPTIGRGRKIYRHTYLLPIFLTVTHCVIESKTHVGRRNGITGANVGPRHPIFFEGRGIDQRGQRGFSTYFSILKNLRKPNDKIWRCPRFRDRKHIYSRYVLHIIYEIYIFIRIWRGGVAYHRELRHTNF